MISASGDFRRFSVKNPDESACQGSLDRTSHPAKVSQSKEFTGQTAPTVVRLSAKSRSAAFGRRRFAQSEKLPMLC